MSKVVHKAFYLISLKSFIFNKSVCGVSVEETNIKELEKNFTSDNNKVTCKRCLNKINKRKH